MVVRLAPQTTKRQHFTATVSWLTLPLPTVHRIHLIFARTFRSLSAESCSTPGYLFPYPAAPEMYCTAVNAGTGSLYLKDIAI